MKLGIMSDSHGRLDRVRRALARLDEAGAEAFVHCGDLGGVEVLEELAGRRCWFVWGNTDYEVQTSRETVESLGLPWPTVPLEITLAGKRIAVCHGHEQVIAQIRREARYDYLLYGHTHRQDDHLEGSMRIINPGALQRAGVPTVALLDLAEDDLRFLAIY